MIDQHLYPNLAVKLSRSRSEDVQKKFNDQPILEPSEDVYGFDAFAKSIARSIGDISGPIGTSIAIQGEWGSGKTSIINLIKFHLQSEVERKNIEIVDFNCWWFRGEEALTLAFLQELGLALEKDLGEKAKEKVAKIAKRVLQAGSVLGPIIGAVSGGLLAGVVRGSINFGKTYFEEQSGLEQVFSSLSDMLKEQDKRFLIVIDDLDRLSMDELTSIFRLVRSVGHLPNVIYLLSFDRVVAEKTLKERYPAEGPGFLEKIIQAAFDIPVPNQSELEKIVLNGIQELGLYPVSDDEAVRFMNVFYDLVAPLIRRPRDNVRYLSILSVTWPALAGEVDPADFAALEAVRLFEPQVYMRLRQSSKKLTGVGGQDDHTDEFLDWILEDADKDRKEALKDGLERLFPRLESMTYGTDFIAEWERKRRVCTSKFFQTYFRFSLDPYLISKDDVLEFIARCGQKDFASDLLKTAARNEGRDGGTMVPVWLDEITSHSRDIREEDRPVLIKEIFSVADTIYLSEDDDKGVGGFANTHLRIHWLIRSLMPRSADLDTRSYVFKKAAEVSEIGWLVDFCSSVQREHFPKKDDAKVPEEARLMNEEHANWLKSHTVERIRECAHSGGLVKHQFLGDILFRWRDFVDDGSIEVSEWINRELEKDDSVIALAKAFTAESWSQGLGMFGAGDRVSKRTFRAQVGGLDSVMDLGVFRERLEGLVDKDNLDPEDREIVERFLYAWDHQDNF